jgi:hypothetical protein
MTTFGDGNCLNPLISKTQTKNPQKHKPESIIKTKQTNSRQTYSNRSKWLLLAL